MENPDIDLENSNSIESDQNQLEVDSDEENEYLEIDELARNESDSNSTCNDQNLYLLRKLSPVTVDTSRNKHNFTIENILGLSETQKKIGFKNSEDQDLRKLKDLNKLNGISESSDAETRRISSTESFVKPVPVLASAYMKQYHQGTLKFFIYITQTILRRDFKNINLITKFSLALTGIEDCKREKERNFLQHSRSSSANNFFCRNWTEFNSNLSFSAQGNN